MGEGFRRSRGYLPHIESGLVPQFVTFRLADAIDSSWWIDRKIQASVMPAEESKQFLRQQIELSLDEGRGSVLLRENANAILVQNALLHGHGKEHILHAFVIMPNHVHLLMTLLPGQSLSQIIKGIKTVSSLAINSRLNRKGRLWQPEYFDRLIRDESHFDKTVHYIEWNPVKAKLVGDPSLYRWSTGNPNVRALLKL